MSARENWNSDRIAALRAEYRRFLAATGWSRPEFAKQSGLADGGILGEAAERIRLALQIGDTPPTEAQVETLEAIERCIHEERSGRGRATPAVFVRTGVVDRAFDVIAAIVNFATIALLLGAPGIGKSYLIAAALAEFPTAIAVTMDSDSRSARGLLTKIAHALGLRRKMPPLEDVVRLLRQRRNGKALPLIIVDQFHLAKDSARQLIADLHDAAGCSVLLVGTVALHRMVTDEADPMFGQFSSRVGLRLDLASEMYQAGPGGGGGAKLYTLEDIKALFRQMKIKLADDGARMLTKLANEPGCGHLRRVVRIAHWAERFASGRGATAIGTEDILAALELVTGEQQQRGAATCALPSRGANTKDKAVG